MSELKVSQEEMMDKFHDKLVDAGKNVSKTFSMFAYRALWETIMETLAQGQSIQVNKLGTFKVSLTSARKCRNPQNGELLNIPAGRKLSLKVSNTMKKELCK